MLTQFVCDNFLKRLEDIEKGALFLTMPDGRSYSFEGREPGPRADIQIHHISVITNLASRGDIGFAEDYRKGLWETSDLQALLTLGLVNEKAFERFVLGSKFMRAISSLLYLLKINTVEGSRKNIHAHYDLGNDFYRLWLDPSMTYSAAIYTKGDQDLLTAQNNKYDRIIDSFSGKSGRVLEIGCGWGGFAERAVHRGDFDIKGVTISEEQYAYAQNRLNGSANIVLEDYRYQKGQYDNIVSIEMFEAVGEQYWQTYFKKLGGLLKQGGKAVIQTITIRDRDFARYRKGGDFIRSYIFPGGMLPSRSKFEEQAAQSGMKTGEIFEFGQDYARTLEQWKDNFDRHEEAVKRLGFDDGFIRLWRFYLAACAAGFRAGRTSVMQAEVTHV